MRKRGQRLFSGVRKSGCGLAVALVFLAGCESEQPVGAGPEQPVPENGDKDKEVVQTPREPPDQQIPQATSSLMLNDGAGLLNGGFEYWVEGVPLHWETRPGMGRYVGKSPDAVSGESCLAMKGGYTYNYLCQVVEASDSLAGRSVAVRVNVKAAEPRTLVGFKLVNDQEVGYAEHPGDGKWHEVIATHLFADTYTANTFRVVLNHAGPPKREALFDDATIRVE